MMSDARYRTVIEKDLPCRLLKRGSESPCASLSHPGLLEQGARGRHARTANFCRELLDEYDPS